MSQARGFLKEFRAFAVRGNVVDLAIGVIVGAAFSKIVDSLVKDIVMPVVNFMVGGAMDFSNKFFVLSRPENYTGPETYADLTKAGATVFAWGNFVTIVINFILLAFVIFWMVKAINKARSKMDLEAEKAPPATPEDVLLLREIRDSLKK
ncbi:large conductance mechanosensitive channel protein MscL [Zwartia vadi]|uniref:large conductance mechanosensitive channel protein MscL n=1 Tax=Zwartia vadi TaxID=3058168 RepID=UPI0025B6133A|nr:large conductance mechanosensitive channel protein MscL [Zwartia vadi]MDN3987798.1 large conductance mechanosensitive channel protein MscL [Zwartia vadi]